MTAGVYRIEIGDSFYYGSSKDLNGRRNSHLSELKRGAHRNPQMQKAWNKYQVLTFTIVEVCAPEIRHECEQKYIDEFYYDSRCMNSLRTAVPQDEWAIERLRAPKSPNYIATHLIGNTRGRGNRGKIQSPEHREKNRLKSLGTTQSEEVRQKKRDAWVRKRADGYISPNKGRPRPVKLND